MEIRKAAISDAPAISSLSKQLGYTISEKDTAHNLQQLQESHNDVVLVAVMNNKVVGWIHVLHTIRVETGSFCEIAGLVVNEEERGKGIGKLLIAKAIAWSKTKNCESLRVRTNVVRTETHEFYKRTGFTLAKEQKVFTMSLE